MVLPVFVGSVRAVACYHPKLQVERHRHRSQTKPLFAVCGFFSTGNTGLTRYPCIQLDARVLMVLGLKLFLDPARKHQDFELPLLTSPLGRESPCGKQKQDAVGRLFFSRPAVRWLVPVFTSGFIHTQCFGRPILGPGGTLSGQRLQSGPEGRLGPLKWFAGAQLRE